MLYREIIAVCSQIHTKHTSTLCGQNVEFCVLNLVVHVITTASGYYVHHLLEHERALCPYSVLACCVWLSQQTALPD